MDVIFIPLLTVISMALGLYRWAVIAYIIISFLEQFNIINRYNQIVYNIHTILFRLVEPALTPIRRIIPAFGAIDFSPLVLILTIVFIQMVIDMLTLKFI